jgi:hypothetical protein
MPLGYQSPGVELEALPVSADSDMEDLAAKTQTLQAVPIFVTSNVSGVG